MNALIVIDYTYDFVVGNLPVGQPALQIEDRITELTEQFCQDGDWVVMAVDAHDKNDPYHPENSLFPVHNVRGTSGRELYGKLNDVYNNHQEKIYWLDKTRYSAFCGTDLDLQLRSRGIRNIYLAGVCTDICVLHTAIDAYNRGYGLTVHADAVASFNHEGHCWALGHFAAAMGAQILPPD